MIVKPAEPFGRRGRPAAPASTPRPRPLPQPALAPLPADLVAAIVRPATAEGAALPATAPAKIRVVRSLRAAVLAGLCVGVFDAALHVTTAPALDKEIATLLGGAALPLPAISLFIGLWSTARTSAMSLLVTHRVLDMFGWTKPLAYALVGGVVAVIYAVLVHMLAPELMERSLLIDGLCGLGAGFFYRFFAGMRSGEPG